MAQDDSDKKDKFDFTAEGEAKGYISLAQARLLAMQTARETPGNYGRRFRGVTMAFEVVESGEDEDYYNITLSFRAEGAFTEAAGREQFFIDKEGAVAHRQVVDVPRGGGIWRLPVFLAGSIVVLVAIIVVALSASGGGDNVLSGAPSGSNTPPSPTKIPVLVIPPTNPSVQTDRPLPTDTSTLLPTQTPMPTPSSRPASTAIPIRPQSTAVPTPTRRTRPPAPTAAQIPAPAPAPTSPPIPTPNVVAISAGMVVSDSELLSQPWVQGARPDIPNYKWGSGSGSQVAYFSLSSDNVTLFASDYSLSNVLKIILFKSSDGGRTWLPVATSGGRCDDDTGPRGNLIFDMNETQKILAHGCGAVWWQSEDGGDSWIISDFAPPGGPVIYPDVIYAGGGFRSEDGGQSWQELITEYPISQGTPGYPSALYAIKTHTTFSIDIFLSTDGTVTWNRIETPQAKDEPYFIFTFDSSSPPNIVLGFPEEGLFRANALDPKDWELLSWPPGSTGLKEVALHPTNPDVLAFTDDDDGVFITVDGADSWVSLHQAGYQIGNVVYNGLPSFSGGRRALVVTGGPSPTICIGSDTGPWCHIIVVTPIAAPAATPASVSPLPVVTPTPTNSVNEGSAPPTGSVAYRGHYYLTVPQRMTWVEAVAYSESLGGYLVTISDEEENRFVADLGQTMYDGWVKHNSFWIGLTDEGQEGRFLWVTGESNSYTNWGGGEPNNSGNEDYVTIGQISHDSWNDHPSKDNRPFVVEFEP